MAFTKRVNRFAHSHRRALLFVGALIALATYIVRDEIRQDLKELTDSIDAAETIFVVRSDNRAVMLEVMRLQQLIKETGPSRELLPANAYFKSLTSELDSSINLLAKVPHDEGFDEKAKGILAKRDEWINESLRPLTPLPERRVPRDKAAEAEEKGLQLKLWSEAINLDSDVRAFGSDVLQLALNAETQQEHRYRISKYVSYFLYLLGLLVGLLGTMVGVEGVNGK